MVRVGGQISSDVIHDSLRSTDSLSRVQANALTEDNMTQYFSLLEKTLTDNDLVNQASHIYNMDETGMPLDHKQLKLVALKGIKYMDQHPEIKLKLLSSLVQMPLVMPCRQW